tara:strand:+ start:5712 stop:6284 length:573 start_codon:yes stop_codon:yes gene_type:complete
MPTTPNLDRAQEARRGPRKSLIDSFNQTNLDTQNPEPNGGPINDPVVVVDGMSASPGFTQTYSKDNPYLQDSRTTQNSILYENGATPSDSESPALKITALDIESPEAGVRQGSEGGPNRTNAVNRKGTVGSDGTYILQNASTNPFTPTPGGEPLKNKEGKEIIQQLNRYTPQDTYMKRMVDIRDKGEDKI